MQILCDKSQRIHNKAATDLEPGSGVPGNIFEKNYFRVPRPAGVNFFHYKHNSRRGLQENMTGFIVRQNPVIDLCIRYGLKATCKGMRPRAAES